MPSWIEITAPAPVLNRPDFQAVFGGSSLPLDPFGHPAPFEFMALKHMQFEVIKQIGPNIVQIVWPDYSDSPLFVDRRFCREIYPTSLLQAPAKQKMDAKSILDHMERRIGTSYVWGGNWAEGSPEMLIYYPPQKPLDPKTQTLWTMQGLDCSGLLFEATNGKNPRNTSHLLQFGRSLSPNEPLEPLDMIIYPGHVLFVRSATTIIESKFPFGVRVCPLEMRWEEISRDRAFVYEWNSHLDKKTHFTVRRF